MNEQDIIRIIERYFNPRIDELPAGTPVVGDYIPYWDKRNGITKRLEAAIFSSAVPTSIEFEWVPNRKDEDGNVWPYDQFDIVTRAGKIYQSLVDNNTSVPGAAGNTLWNLLTRNYSGGWWAPGVYTDTRIIVYSDHTGDTQLYELITPTRPFISTDIATEESLGLWAPLFGKVRREIIDTSTGEVRINFAKQSEKYFEGSANISQPTIWLFEHVENAVRGNILFTMAALHTVQFPNNTNMSTPTYDPITQLWTPFDVGVYRAEFEFNTNGDLFVQIFGPFKGGSNQPPTVVVGAISRNVNTLDAPRTYFDAEGDLENNRPPEVRELELTAGQYVGDTVQAIWDFYSHMGYAQGTHRYQWYRQNEDGTNREAIAGEVDFDYTFTLADVGKAVLVGVIAVQVADAPANGNPESVETFSSVALVEENVVIPELDFATVANHYFKHGTFDNTNKRYADLGLSGAGNYATAPVGKEPTLNADGSLSYNPSVSIQCLRFPVIAGSSVKTHDFFGIFKMNAAAITQHMWAIISNTFFRFQNTGTLFQAGFNGNIEYAEFEPVANTWYAYRLRLYTNGTIHGARLQINKNIEAGTYLFDLDRLYVPADRNGTTWAAGSAALGAATNETGGLNGHMTETAMIINAHLDPTLEDRAWTRLNNIKALLT